MPFYLLPTVAPAASTHISLAVLSTHAQTKYTPARKHVFSQQSTMRICAYNIANSIR